MFGEEGQIFEYEKAVGFLEDMIEEKVGEYDETFKCFIEYPHSVISDVCGRFIVNPAWMKEAELLQDDVNQALQKALPLSAIDGQEPSFCNSTSVTTNPSEESHEVYEASQQLANFGDAHALLDWCRQRQPPGMGPFIGQSGELHAQNVHVPGIEGGHLPDTRDHSASTSYISSNTGDGSRPDHLSCGDSLVEDRSWRPSLADSRSDLEHSSAQKSVSITRTKYECLEAECVRINRRYETQGELTKHLNRKHRPKCSRRHGCPCCSERYDTPMHLKRHIDSVHLKLYYYCPEVSCQKSYSKHDGRKVHMKKAHPTVNIPNHKDRAIPDSPLGFAAVTIQLSNAQQVLDLYLRNNWKLEIMSAQDSRPMEPTPLPQHDVNVDLRHRSSSMATSSIVTSSSSKPMTRTRRSASAASTISTCITTPSCSPISSLMPVRSMMHKKKYERVLPTAMTTC